MLWLKQAADLWQPFPGGDQRQKQKAPTNIAFQAGDLRFEGGNDFDQIGFCGEVRAFGEPVGVGGGGHGVNLSFAKSTLSRINKAL